jgi:hypothetical protein
MLCENKRVCWRKDLILEKVRDVFVSLCLEIGISNWGILVVIDVVLLLY